MLQVEKLTAGYGRTPVLDGIDLEVAEGETVALVGPNGAGKTTLARSLTGQTRITHGRVLLEGKDVTSLSSRQLTLRGVVQVPEGRRLFPRLSVSENLDLAFYARRAVVGSRRARLLQEALEQFPILGVRRDQPAGTLSGGEQQMLAIARALLLEPRLLILDEPSIGLAPVVRKQIFETIVSQVQAAGCGCLLIEQRARDALRISSRGYVLERGVVVHSGPADHILNDDDLRRTYVGV